MAAVFCLRLACGLVTALVLLSPAQVHPRFFRVQYWAALGLTAVAGFFLREDADASLWMFLTGAGLCYLLASIVWQLEGAPGHRLLLILAAVLSSAALVLGSRAVRPGADAWWRGSDDLSAAAFLGTATTAMLMGHSYLVAPAMSLVPLFRLLAGLGASLGLRMALAATGLWWWTTRSAGVNLDTEMVLWLAVRWALGFLGPLILGWLAWETARIRSTQSATGILYVVVIVCFLGELTSQLLVGKTGYTL